MECVPPITDTVGVINGQTTGQIVRALMERAGYTVRDFARAAGYAHGSGVQRYIEPDFDAELTLAVAKRLRVALEGRGTPAISAHEVMTLAGLDGVVEARPNTELAPRYMDLPRDVPIYGTAVGTYSEDERIEQTVVELGEVLDLVERPIGAAKREGVYGLFVEGDSQAPRFETGDLIFVDPKAAARVGDDVVVYLKKADGDGESVGAVLVKRLLRKGHDRVELRQLNPPADFSVDARKVTVIHKVMTTKELYGIR